MPTLVNSAPSTSITLLAWDTNHFGFSVGRIAAEASDGELQAALDEARTQGYRLIYWATSPDRSAPQSLLAQFDGRLVDRKVTFARPLTGVHPAPPSNDLVIAPVEGTQCPPALIALAVAAGAYSRFAVDPRIPRDKFERLYGIWIERSVRGEIADAVLVARDSAEASNDLAGVITVKVTHGVGNIGLVAVSESHRGRGIGSHLIQAAHRWMIERGANRSTVVTQGDNAPACRLYERAGYSIEQSEHFYHFWP